MRKFGKDKFWNCLRIFRRGDDEIWHRQVLKMSQNISKRRWGNSAKTSFEIVLEYFEFRRGDEEIWQRTSFKIVLEYFEEAMRKFGKDKFWNCLRIVRRGDEEIWQRQVLKMSQNISKRRWGNLAKTRFKNVSEYFEEAMRKFGKDKFWNCLRIFRRGDEEIWQRQVLKLS